MKFSTRIFLKFVLIIQLISLGLTKKKELQTLALALLLGGAHRNNNQPTLIPLHPYGMHGGMQHPMAYGPGHGWAAYEMNSGSSGIDIGTLAAALLFLKR